MKTSLLKILSPYFTKREKKLRKLSQIQIENFDLNDFLFHRENRS